MSKFSRGNLNRIKQICGEKTGVDLPMEKGSNSFKIIGVIIAVLLVLTPLTVYGTAYTLSSIEYRESEVQLGITVAEFVSDFVESIYGDSAVLVVNDESESSVNELIRMSVIGFKHSLDPSGWEEPSLETLSLGVRNNGTTWYTGVRAEIDEYPNSEAGEEYTIHFYLKYEGFGSYFVLTDMYFYTGLDISKDIYGDIGVLGKTLDMDHFIAWADNTSEFSEYISNARECYSEYLEYMEAEAFALDFMRNYISFVYRDENPWVDKEGQIYSLIKNSKTFINYWNSTIKDFGAHEDGYPMYTTQELVFDNGYWYYSGMILGELLTSAKEWKSDFRGDMCLKFKKVDETFEVEDFFLSGPATSMHNIFGRDIGIRGFGRIDNFVSWADSTNDYSEFIENCNNALNKAVRENVIDGAALDFASAFIDSAFCGGIKPENVIAEKSLDKFISDFIDYLKLSTSAENIDEYTYEIRPSISMDEESVYYQSLIVNITGKRNDGTEVKYRTKMFLELILDGDKAVVTDFYYNGDLPQCSVIFEKVGKNHYSMIDREFYAWAENLDDYGVFSQKALSAIQDIQQ